MKTCTICSSTAFDDMSMCYGCLNPFEKTASIILEGCTPDIGYTLPDLEMCIEEPVERVYKPISQNMGTTRPNAALFHVSTPNQPSRDVYLQKAENQELTIGTADDNNVVLPNTTNNKLSLRIFYSHKKIWAEDISSSQQTLINGVFLTGVRSLSRGTAIKIGETTIELVAV